MMRHVRVMIGCLMLALGAVAAAAEAPPAPTPEPTPKLPLERCRDFCARVYGSDTAERSECADACGEADACSRLCVERFPADEGKRATCLKLCMRPRTPAP